MNSSIYMIRPFLIFLFAWYSCMVYSQDKSEVNGIITGIADQPVFNVAISIEGVIADPVITDEDGRFTLVVPDKYVWLMISPVGNYKPQRVFLNGRDFVKIRLVTRDRESGFDMVSGPLMDMPRRNLTGGDLGLDISLVSKLPYQTIDQYFQGRVPGMISAGHSGMPGFGTYSYMRGLNSLNAGNQPLIIVDGMPYESHGLFPSIVSGYVYNPYVSIVNQDIIDVRIIKDISMTALYGAKASNGIIWINTLRPTETTTTMDISLKTGLNLSARPLPVLDNEQYRTLAHEILMTSHIMEEEYKDLFPGLFDDPTSRSYFRYNHNTGWQEEVLRNSTFNDLYMSVKGGDEIAKYGLSFDFSQNNGILKETDFSRISLRFVGSFNIFRWLQLYANNNLMYASSNLMESGPVDYSNPLLAGLLKSPVMYPYQFDREGNQLSYFDEVDNLGISNPLAIINGVMANNNNYRFVGTYRINADVTRRLKWSSMLGVNLNTSMEAVFLPNAGMVEYYDRLAYNVTRRQSNYLRSLYNDNRLFYSNTFRNIHSLQGFLGFSLYANTLEQDIGTGMNTPSDDYRSLRFAETIFSEISGEIGIWNSLMFYGGANYAMKDKYFFGLNYSLDGSSRVGKEVSSSIRLLDTPFGVFPSVSGAWRVSGENFLKNTTWLSNFMISSSYGLSGNDNIGNYNSRVYYEQRAFRETTGIVLGTMPNTQLRFETNVMFDAGIDLSMFGERINLSLNYFNNLSKDLFILEKQSSFIGYNHRPVNEASMRNKGFEWNFWSRLVESDKFNLDFGMHLTGFQNSVVDISGGSQVIGIENGEIIAKSGHPVFSFYGYSTDGIFATTGEAEAAGLVNGRGMPFSAGDVRFLDLSGPEGIPDGVIDDYDKTIIGSHIPDYSGGVSLGIGYGRFSIHGLLQFVLGNDVFNYTRYQTEKMSDLSNQVSSVLRRWTYEGQQTNMPRALWNDPAGNTEFSDRWIEDGSYLRVKNVVLSYEIPENTWFLRNANVYLSVNNLFTFTRYLGYDPEVSYSPWLAGQGLDYGQIPMIRSFMIGVKFGL